MRNSWSRRPPINNSVHITSSPKNVGIGGVGERGTAGRQSDKETLYTAATGRVADDKLIRDSF